ncbi:hypothetical protein Efla_007578 [Eimeria flavescens]
MQQTDLALALALKQNESTSKLAKAGLQQRILAAGNGDNDALNSILEECLSVAEESGLLLTPLPSQDDTERPARKIARLELALRLDASAFEASQTSLHSTLKVDSSNDPSHYSSSSLTAGAGSLTASDTQSFRASLRGPGLSLEQNELPVQQYTVEGLPLQAAAPSDFIKSRGAERPFWPAAPAGVGSFAECEKPSSSGWRPEAAKGNLYSPTAPTRGPIHSQHFPVCIPRPTDTFSTLSQESSHIEQLPQLRESLVQSGTAGFAHSQQHGGSSTAVDGEFVVKKEAAALPAGLHVENQPHTSSTASTASSLLGSSTDADANGGLAMNGAEEQPPDVGPPTSLVPLAEVPPRQPWAPNVHPYVRLPVVDPAAVQRNFCPDGYIDPRYYTTPAVGPLQTIRILFLKPSLNPEEVEELFRAAEALVNYYRRRVKPILKHHRPFQVLRRLTMDFLVLDALVAARYILGERMLMGNWWSAFIQHFPTQVKFNLPPRGVRAASLTNLKRVKRLLEVIQIYKTGVRPGDKQIVKLKRMIFDLRYATSPYRGPAFDRWREDDMLFLRSNEDAGNADRHS